MYRAAEELENLARLERNYIRTRKIPKENERLFHYYITEVASALPGPTLRWMAELREKTLWFARGEIIRVADTDRTLVIPAVNIS